MSLWKRKYRAMPVAMMLLALTLTGCNAQTGEEPVAVVAQVAVNNSNPMVEAQVTKVTYGNVVKKDLYDGVVTPYVEELYFKGDGTFLDYRVAVGETVEKGQVLARTDTTAMKEQIEKLEERIATLTENYQYQLQTLKNSEELIVAEMDINYLYLSMKEYLSPDYTRLCKQLGQQDRSLKTNQLEQKQLTERYELELPYLQKQLDALKKGLNKNVIKAPFDGVVAELRSVAGGDRVNENTPFVAIADTERYLVVSEYVGSSIIDKAHGVYAFINGTQYEAEYIPMDKELYSKVMAGEGTAYSTYEIQPDGSFEFGQTVKLSIVRDFRENVLRIPHMVVVNEGTQRYCYVKRGDEREKVYIETGITDGLYYEVRSGLAEGDEVFLE